MTQEKNPSPLEVCMYEKVATVTVSIEETLEVCGKEKRQGETIWGRNVSPTEHITADNWSPHLDIPGDKPDDVNPNLNPMQQQDTMEIDGEDHKGGHTSSEEGTSAKAMHDSTMKSASSLSTATGEKYPQDESFDVQNNGGQPNISWAQKALGSRAQNRITGPQIDDKCYDAAQNYNSPISRQEVREYDMGKDPRKHKQPNTLAGKDQSSKVHPGEEDSTMKSASSLSTATGEKYPQDESFDVQNNGGQPNISWAQKALGSRAQNRITGPQIDDKCYDAAQNYNSPISRQEVREYAAQLRRSEVQMKTAPASDYLDTIDVKFHVVLSPQLEETILKGGQLFIITEKNCHPPWKILVAEMQQSDESNIANKAGKFYMTGVWKLNPKEAGHKIAYKYYIHDPLRNYYTPEHIYHPQINALYDRCLIIPKDVKAFEKYDDFVCKPSNWKNEFIVNHNQVAKYRKDATKIMLSTINVKYIESHGVKNALKKRKAILKAYEKNGTWVMAQGSRSLNTFDSKEFSKRDIDMAEMREFHRQLKYGMDFKPLIYHILWVQDSEITYESFESLHDILNALKTFYPTLEALPIDSSSHLALKKALVGIANKFFYFLNNSRQQIVPSNPSLWIIILPLIMMTDAKIKSTDQLLKDIDTKTWEDATRTYRKPTRFIAESTICFVDRNLIEEPFVMEAILRLAPASEIKRLLCDVGGRKQLAAFPLDLVFDRYIDIVSLINLEDNIFKDGAEGMLEKTTLDLSELNKRSSEIDQDASETKAEALALLKRLSRSYERYAYEQRGRGNFAILLLYVDMVTTFEELGLLSAADITGYSDRVVRSTIDTLIYDNPDRSWNKWNGLMTRRESLATKTCDLIVRSLGEVITKTDAFLCLDFYIEKQNHKTDDRLVEIVLERVTDGLIQAEASEKSSWFSPSGVFSKLTKRLPSSDNRQKLAQVLSGYFMKTFGQERGYVEKILKVLCASKAECKMFQLLSQMKFKDFDPNTKSLLRNLERDLWDSWIKLNDGKETIQFYENHFNEKDNWVNLHMMLENVTSVVNDMDRRNIEPIDPNKITELSDKIKLFKKCCKSLENIKAILVENQRELVKMDSLPKTPSLSSVQFCEIEKNFDSILGLTESEQKIIANYLECYKESSVFSQFWKEHARLLITKKPPDEQGEFGNGHEIQQFSWQDYKDLLVEIKAMFEKFKKSFREEVIQIKTINHYLQDSHNIEKELKFLGLHDHLRKVEYLKQFQSIKAAVQSFRKMLTHLSITTEFKVIMDIEESFDHDTFQEKKLSEVSESMISKGDYFKEWTKNDIEALTTFNNSTNILNWLKKYIRDNKDLNVFLDLASISAGESAIEIGKLACFQSAVNGFSPLYFDINASSTLQEILFAVQNVFRNIKRDNKLCKSLKDTNEMVNWIRYIYDLQGSVETLSLATVQQICTTGKVLITAKNKMGQRWTDFKEAISMSYKIDKDKKTMNYSELDELRSKLMLITIKEDGEVDVERFTQILSHVEVVSKALYTLLDSGCHLFSELKIDGYMDMDKKVKLQIDFGHKSGVIQVPMLKIIICDSFTLIL